MQAKERSGQPLTPEQQAQKATAAAKLSQCMTNRQKISEIAQSYLQRNGQMAPSAAPVVDPQKKMMVEQLNNELRKLTPQQREQMLRQAVAKLQQVQSSSGDVLKQLSPIERHILSLHRLQKQTALMRQQQQQLALQQQQQLQQGVGGSGASASNGAFQYQQHMQRQSQQPHSQQMQPDQQQVSIAYPTLFVGLFAWRRCEKTQQNTLCMYYYSQEVRKSEIVVPAKLFNLNVVLRNGVFM